jgi:hypothetical protein
MGKRKLWNKHLPSFSRSLSGITPTVTRKPEQASSYQKGMKCHLKAKAFLLSHSWGVGFVPGNQLLGRAAESLAANRWTGPAGSLCYF